MKNKPIAPFFFEEPPKQKKSKDPFQESQLRKKRFDKTASMKFPVTEMESRELRRLYSFYKEDLQATSITEFFTMLLRYGLRHPELLKTHFVYENTGTYKTVKPNQIEKSLIAGGNGFAIEWGVSERKTLHHIIFSVMEYLKKGGKMKIEEIQPIRPLE
ncbi:MAG: hypothetical protein Q8934_08805 [Bacillota bacterium]|nr:hypothetical protein [Bacillota bacterium]